MNYFCNYIFNAMLFWKKKLFLMWLKKLDPSENGRGHKAKHYLVNFRVRYIQRNKATKICFSEAETTGLQSRGKNTYVTFLVNCWRLSACWYNSEGLSREIVYDSPLHTWIFPQENHQILRGGLWERPLMELPGRKRVFIVKPSQNFLHDKGQLLPNPVLSILPVSPGGQGLGEDTIINKGGRLTENSLGMLYPEQIGVLDWEVTEDRQERKSRMSHVVLD